MELVMCITHMIAESSKRFSFHWTPQKFSYRAILKKHYHYDIWSRACFHLNFNNYLHIHLKVNT